MKNAEKHIRSSECSLVCARNAGAQTLTLTPHRTNQEVMLRESGEWGFLGLKKILRNLILLRIPLSRTTHPPHARVAPT